MFLFSLKNHRLQRPLTPERNDGRYFLKCRPRFEDSVDNGAVEVTFESRTAQISALVHIFVLSN